MKKIFRTICLGALAAALVSCAAEDSVRVNFPFKDCSFELLYESESTGDNTTAVKLEREFSFTDSDFLSALAPYKDEPNVALEIADKRFRITRKVTGIATASTGARTDTDDIDDPAPDDTGDPDDTDPEPEPEPEPVPELADIADVLLIASVDGVEIARWGMEELDFSKSVTNEDYERFVDALFNAVVEQRKTVKVVFTGTLLDYVVAEADREKVLVTYDFLQLMMAKITIER